MYGDEYVSHFVMDVTDVWMLSIVLFSLDQ